MELKEKPGYIITEIILNIQGKFTAEELFLSLKHKMKNMFPDEKEMKDYIYKKIETLKIITVSLAKQICSIFQFKRPKRAFFYYNIELNISVSPFSSSCISEVSS